VKENLMATILIVDDSATIRALIRRAIALSGISAVNIVEASSGREGLEAAAAHSPDLVLADLQMPEMNGIEMIDRLLANPDTRSIPIVVVSAEPNRETIESLKRLGIRGHLAKPFTPESIRDLIGGVLETSRA
jgi:two-component system chemotaxis response regulator CheY